MESIHLGTCKMGSLFSRWSLVFREGLTILNKPRRCPVFGVIHECDWPKYLVINP